MQEDLEETTTGPSAGGAAGPIWWRRKAEVSVGMGPEGVVIDPDRRRCYVVCSRSNWLAAIDMDSLEVDATVQVGTEPIAVVHDPVRDRLFTTDARTSTMSVVDAARMELVGQVPVGAYCAGAGIHVAGRKVLSGDTADGTITVVDLDSLDVLGRAQCGFGSGSIAVDEARNRAYVANFGDDSVTVVDLDALRPVATIPVGAAPCKIEIDAAGRSGYVAGSLTSELVVLDLDSLEVADRIPVERAPVGLAVQGDHIYVANRGAGTVSVISATHRRERHRIRVGDAPGDVAVNPATGTLYVSNAGSCDLTVLEPTVHGREPQDVVPQGPDALVGTPLPPWDLYDARTGRRMTSEAWTGRKYIVNFFASW